MTAVGTPQPATYVGRCPGCNGVIQVGETITSVRGAEGLCRGEWWHEECAPEPLSEADITRAALLRIGAQVSEAGDETVVTVAGEIRAAIDQFLASLGPVAPGANPAERLRSLAAFLAELDGLGQEVHGG